MPASLTAFGESLRKLANKFDAEIDNLVYDIYGITEEERKIVES